MPTETINVEVLEMYFCAIKYNEYVASYQQLSTDPEVTLIAEEGMSDYACQLESL